VRDPLQGQILVLDGHDAAGKSTLVGLLSDRLGAQVVKPFAGPLGDLIAWLWGDGRFEEADMVARLAVERANQVSARAVFDRHWLSLFTVLPERMWERWLPLPPTVLCWADVETTCRRLEIRGEPVGDRAAHEYYVDRYRVLAERLGVPIVDTAASSEEDCVEEILGLWPNLGYHTTLRQG